MKELPTSRGERAVAMLDTGDKELLTKSTRRLVTNCIYMYVCVCVCVCGGVYVCIYMYVCVCVCVCV